MLVNSVTVRALALAVLAATGACAGGLSGSDYGRAEVGRIARLETGVIERVRSVRIEGSKTIIGPATGAVIGGIAGSSVGGGDEERAIMAVAGAVLGGLAGGAIEKSVTQQTGYAYTIRLTNGETVTIVQADKTPLAPGQKVTVEYGDRARVAPL